jgi:hypothetical protein
MKGMVISSRSLLSYQDEKAVAVADAVRLRYIRTEILHMVSICSKMRMFGAETCTFNLVYTKPL